MSNLNVLPIGKTYIMKIALRLITIVWQYQRGAPLYCAYYNTYCTAYDATKGARSQDEYTTDLVSRENRKQYFLNLSNFTFDLCNKCLIMYYF